MEKEKIKLDHLSGVEKTLLLPLYSRALDFKSPRSILNDSKASELVEKIDYDFAGIKKAMKGFAIIGHSVRARYFDEQVRRYLEHFPSGVVVSLGSGLDTRFYRVDNGKVTFFDLDLPETINIRRKLVDESPRNPFIGCSVLDYSWISKVAAITSKQDCPVLFIAEGLFMYIPLPDVQSLFQQLAVSFPKAEIIFEVYSSFMVKDTNKEKSLKKLQVEFKWSVKNSRDIESWHPNLQFISEWDFFDAPEIRTGILRILGLFSFYRKMTRIVHYKFT
ncbi:MAG: class I SAM-dependent methyltransferase [Candidatus Odinarchaeota archaeon]